MTNKKLSKDSFERDCNINSLSKKQNNDFNNSSSLEHDFYCKIISKIQSLVEISQIRPIGYIVELGSNEQASYHLHKARDSIESIAYQAYWSTEFTNPDYTATPDKPKPDYTNQCGYLILNSLHNDQQNPPSLGELVKSSKVIEKQIQQDFYQAEKINQLEINEIIQNLAQPKNRVVIIDIDILAIVTDSNELIAIKERYPLKHHEWVGLIELHENNWLL
ncbi:hypothetical protein [Psychrobacter sp.]|uniref:hypothetical protein n=1 Tax=Psychrobacter sp. TaxID=56811 RepID=UPI0025F66D35|nr:hypothetical protein [Psychrobacter sp.]